MSRKIMSALLISSSLVGCTTNAPQTIADSETAQHLVQDMPPTGFARLCFFDGRFINGTHESFIAAHFKADEFIDGVPVGGLNGADVLIIDVPPGQHTLLWRERSNAAPVSKPIVVQLSAGQRVFVSNDYRMQPVNPWTVPLFAFGAIGGAVAGAINGSEDDGTIGPIMTVRPNGGEMTAGYAVVLPVTSATQHFHSGAE